MGKLILFIIVCFALYWASEYYKGGKARKEERLKDKYNPERFDDSDGDPDALEEYYKRKINEMEEASVKGAEQAQEKLEYYKQKLQKLNNLENK